MATGYQKPLSAIREAKEVVYKLLAGNSVDIDGETIKSDRRKA